MKTKPQAKKPALPRIALSSLTLNPDNPRSLSQEVFETLKESIERDPEFMALRPLVIDEHRMILGGNQRYRAMQALGMTTIPEAWVKDGSNLSAAAKRRFILIDNSPKGMSGMWDFEILANTYELDELHKMGFADWELGISIDELDPHDEWKGMPEFKNEDKTAFRSIIIHMEDQDAVDALSKLLQQPITEKTQALYYPKNIVDKIRHLAYK